VRLHGLQVAGVTAVPDAAKMVEVEPVRDVPEGRFVHDDVDTIVRLLEADTAVPRVIMGSLE
jgi:hypothetical protein